MKPRMEFCSGHVIRPDAAMMAGLGCDTTLRRMHNEIVEGFVQSWRAQWPE